MTKTQTLHGKRILVTREESQANEFASLIEKHDGIPIKVPLLNITCRNVFENDLQIREKMNQFEWIFFTSSHGVDCFFEQFGSSIHSKEVKFATVGHKTEKALIEHGFTASFIPTTYNAEVMAEEFFIKYPEANNILLVRGNISRKLLVSELTKRKLAFDTLVVYDTTYFSSMKETLLHVIAANHLDYLTFTSPSTVKAFMELVEDHPMLHDILHIPTVCIGTTTEKAAINFQFKKTIIPKMFTIEGMIEKMLEIEWRNEDDNFKVNWRGMNE